MPPYTQLYLHAVWATHNRLPLVVPDIELHVYDAIRAACRRLGTQPIAVGGLPDHVHLLARLSPTVTVADLLESAKRASAEMVGEQVRPGWLFEWQSGYGAFSLARETVPRAINYVNNQKSLHAAHTVWEDWERCEAPTGDDWAVAR